MKAKWQDGNFEYFVIIMEQDFKVSHNQIINMEK